MSDANEKLIETLAALAATVARLEQKLDDKQDKVEVKKLVEEPKPKRRGRPPGSKNKQEKKESPAKAPKTRKQIVVNEDAELDDDEMDASELFGEDYADDDDDDDGGVYRQNKTRMRQMTAGLQLGPRPNEFDPKQAGHNSDREVDKKLLAPFVKKKVNRSQRRQATYVRIRCRTCGRKFKEPKGIHLHPNWKCNDCAGGGA